MVGVGGEAWACRGGGFSGMRSNFGQARDTRKIACERRTGARRGKQQEVSYSSWTRSLTRPTAAAVHNDGTQLMVAIMVL